MRNSRRFLLAGSLLGGLLNAADVAPPPMLTYQGRLVEDSLPVSGERNFVFSIVNTSGTVLWTSGTVKLSVRSGLYSTVLGTNGMPVIPTSVLGLSDLRLRITVASTTLSPDISLVPALQARAAWEAITVTGPFAGDASGTQNAIVVKGLLGRPLDGNLIPQAGQALVFDGQAWAPANVAAASSTIADNAVTTAKIADGAVTNAKLAVNTITSDRIVNVAWGKLTGLPTTIAGYGITDAVTNTGGVPSIRADLAANRPNFGSAGRIFIATDTNTISRDTGSAWVQIGSGSAGLDGKTVLNGTINPTSEGVNGDFYINTATSTIFGPKTGGTWGSGTSLVGPATGAAGGDLSGTYPNPTVLSVANVTTGTLALANGGTGASDAATARSNLGLGGAAVLNVGTAAGTVAAGNDSRFSDTRTPTDNSVTSAKIVDGTIVAADLANGAVSAGKIAAGAIVDTDVSTTAAIAGSKINPDFGSQNLLTTGNLTTGGRIASGMASKSNDADGTSVAAINTLEVTAATTINTLTGGVAGQQLYLFNSSAANTVVIAHDATLTNGIGTIRCPGGVNVSLPAFGGVTLICNAANNWFVVGRPTVYE